jgi:vacuolar-type H+-ATPase subunit E/Vma4
MSDTQRIIELLEDDRKVRETRQQKVDEQFEHLHNCIHNIDNNISGISSYFIGMDAKEHIIQHAKFKENEEMMNHIRKAVWGSIISIVFAVIVAITQYTAAAAQKDLASQVAELAKQVKPEKTDKK